MKFGVNVMPTVNFNLEDRLVNGLVGVVMGFKVVNNKGKIVFIKSEDKAAGRIAMHNNKIALENHWGPIEKFQASLVFRKVNPNHVLSTPNFC